MKIILPLFSVKTLETHVLFISSADNNNWLLTHYLEHFSLIFILGGGLQMSPCINELLLIDFHQSL